MLMASGNDGHWRARGAAIRAAPWMPRNAAADTPKVASSAVVWARSAAEISEMATRKSLTARVVAYLPWIWDRAAMIFQQSPAQRGDGRRMTFVIPSR